MRNLFLISTLLLFCLSLQAQTPGRVTIRGSLIDSTGTILPGATVMLLTPADSSLESFGRSGEQGKFEFRNVRRATYLLKITYVGYLPYQEAVTPGPEAVTDLGSIKLKPIAKELFEVVIKTAKAPLSIRGDTVEYNASSFKVPPGSTVEDLLRKLPGMQIDQDGGIRAQGQEVRKVTVDGKNFFGSDPKMATKNLPAEAISKVQVFNDKSEQAKITGVDDGKNEKTLNLELKESHKKGGFGKVTAGGGPMSKVGGVNASPRAEARGNYNRFNQKEQFSVIGLGNNTNQTGLSWNDYQDFRGSQSFNFGDDGDFGFSNGGRFIIFTDDDNNSFSLPISNNRGRGFSSNAAGGANYNSTTKKTKASSSYYYNQIHQTLDARQTRENFLPGGASFGTEDKNARVTFNRNHRFNGRFEQTLDSLNTLLLIVNGRNNAGNETFSSAQDFFRAGSQTSRTEINNASDFSSFAFASSLIFRHRFKKKGRNFAASLGYNLNDTDGTGIQQSTSRFIGTSAGEVLPNQNQRTRTDSRQGQLKASLLYVEPVSKRIFWESFYNFSVRNDLVDRDVFDRRSEQMTRNDTLSRYYTNDYLYNRLGTGLRYSYKGLNVSAGMAGARFLLDGQFAPDQTATRFTKVNRTFSTVVPNIGLNIDLKNNRWMYSDYSVDVQMPSARDLQPVIDNSNPRFIRVGNPDLLPQLTHRINAGLGMFNAANFTNLWVNVNYGQHINQIVYNQTVDPITLVTTSTPGNLSGGNMFNTYVDFGFPLKKTKATMGVNSSLNFSRTPLLVNQVLNTTRSQGYRFGTSLNLTPVEFFTFYARANWGITDTRYSINTSQNQQIYNHTYNGDMNFRLPKALFLNANFNYQIFINRRFGFDQKLPILNLSAYKIFMKDNRAEVRLTAYDLFNRNQGINQQATQNFISTERVQTLARYFMLTFTYNMRGVKDQMRRNGGF